MCGSLKDVETCTHRNQAYGFMIKIIEKCVSGNHLGLHLPNELCENNISK